METEMDVAGQILVEARGKINMWVFSTDRFGKEKLNGTGHHFLNIFPKNSSLVFSRLQIPKGKKFNVLKTKLVADSAIEFWEIADLNQLFTPAQLASKKFKPGTRAFVRFVDAKKAG